MKKPTKLVDKLPSDLVPAEVTHKPVLTDRSSLRASTSHEEVQPENGDTHLRTGGMKPKLPKLHLPKFAGNITKFQTFWDSFESAVHMNPDLSSIDKFNYVFVTRFGKMCIVRTQYGNTDFTAIG